MHKQYSACRPLLPLLVLLTTSCDWPWLAENPKDQARCSPRCKVDEFCLDGKCVLRDGFWGIFDKAPLDSGSTSDLAKPKDLSSQPIEGLVHLQEIRDSSSNAQQGYAKAFFAPYPHPYFKKLKSLGLSCWTYDSNEVGPAQYDAGLVTISGGKYTVNLKAEKQKKPDDWLYPAMLFPDLFGASTTLKVVATGKTVQPFSGTVQGVADLQVTFPTGSAYRTKALSLAFKATSGTVQAVLWGVEPGKKLNGKVVCFGLGLTGKMEVPAAALAALPKAAYAVQVRIGLVRDQVIKQSTNLTVHLVTANLTQKTYPLK